MIESKQFQISKLTNAISQIIANWPIAPEEIDTDNRCEAVNTQCINHPFGCRKLRLAIPIASFIPLQLVVIPNATLFVFYSTYEIFLPLHAVREPSDRRKQNHSDRARQPQQPRIKR